MTLNKFIVGGLLLLSITGCGENFQSTFTGKAVISRNDCPSGSEGSYDIRVNAQVSGDMNLSIVQMVNSSSKKTDGSAKYFTTNVKMNGPFIGGDSQFGDSNLRIFKDSDIDSITFAGSINTDRTEISGLEITRRASETGGACTIVMRAELLTRE